MSTIHPGQWRLSRIQLINWGTFNGIVDIPVSRTGFLITGGSGSGKSTLIDAISTVLIPTDRITFNAAAHSETRPGKGRDLVSYIRGAWRTTEDLNTGAVVAQYLRPKATFSVIVLSYDNGYGVTHSLVALFYLRAGANSPSEVIRLFGVLPDRSVTAEKFIPYLKKGLDKRGIKRDFNQATFSENHSVFATKFRPLLGISSVEALLLLQRTQSAKSLDNLNHLFRAYMLTEPDTFELAQRAVEQFTDLETAYDRVQDIKSQVEVLSPLEELHRTIKKTQSEIDRLNRLQDGLPTVSNRKKIEQLHQEFTAAEATLAAAKIHDARAQEQLRLAQETYSLAHNAITGEAEVLRLKLEHHQQELDQRQKNLQQFHDYITDNHSSPPTTAAEFIEFKNTAAIAISEHPDEIQRLNDEAAQCAVTLAAANNRVAALQRELTAAAKSQSNIGAEYLELRTAICEEFNLMESELPFAGELIDVTADATDWEPVIQRILSGFATHLLIPQRYYKEIVSYINNQKLPLKLCFNSIDPLATFTPKKVSPYSLVTKLQVAEHEFHDWISAELSHHYDYICVDSAAELEQLEKHEKGTTKTGLIRYAQHGTDGTVRMEKDDTHQLHDQLWYRLGSTNQQRVELLQHQLREQQAELTAAKNKLQLVQTRINDENHQFQFAQWLNSYEWEHLDPQPIATAIDQLTERLAELTTQPELATLLAAENHAKEELDAARKHAHDATLTVGAAQNQKTDLETKLAQAQTEPAVGLSTETETELEQLFHARTRRVTTGNVEKLTLEISTELTAQLKRSNAHYTQTNSQVSRILALYLERWPNEKADLEATPEFASEALAKLQLLKGERLTEFSNQFRTLVNDMSTRNLATIAESLRRAPAEIKERIAPVNDSLRSSEFSPGRFLRIDVRDTPGDIVLTFQRDLEEAISGEISNHPETDAEARYHTIASLIRKLGSKEAADMRWQTTVLDTRRHVSFIGVEINNHDEVLNTYIDSSSLSGGQAQKLVFFCLAAALRYQLAATDAHLPSYATVILDEAFDRADPAYTERAMDVFTAFGFHMVLATPLKLISTLSKYVGNTIVIAYEETTNADGQTQGQSSIATIDWELS